MNPANLAMLELAFEHLGELRDEVVFVGGATVELWITAISMPESRAPFLPVRSRETEWTSSFYRGFED